MSQEARDRDRGMATGEHDADVAGVRFSTVVLEQLLDAVTEASDVESAASRLLDVVVSLLGLSRASMALLAERDSTMWLDPVAAAGEHAFLAKDMPSLPLDSSSDASRAVETGQAVLVGDVHGVGERLGDTSSGVGRWRAGMNAQSYAVLPLQWRNRAIGTLTVEWATPHPFDVHDRETLEWFAASVAAAVGSFEERHETTPVRSDETSAAAPSHEPGPPYGPPEVASLAFTPDAQVGLADAVGAETGARVLVTIACAGVTGDRSAPFFDLVPLEGLSTVILGVASAPVGGAAAWGERCRQVLRAAVLSGVDATTSLRLLSAWAAGTGQAGSDVCAGILEIDTANSAVLAAQRGYTTFAMLGADGRLSVTKGDAARAGGALPHEPVVRGVLALAGDRFALSVSGASVPDSLDQAGGLARLHEDALSSDDPGAASRLAEWHRIGHTSAVSAVVDIEGSGRE